MTEPNQKPLEQIAEQIERVGDELRVRVHLAGLEAKDAWDRAHLERIGDELRRVADEAKVQGSLAGLEAKDAWHRIEQRLGTLSGRVGAGADEIVRELAASVEEISRAFRGRRRDDDQS
jgi:hypothetical protein